MFESSFCSFDSFVDVFHSRSLHSCNLFLSAGERQDRGRVIDSWDSRRIYRSDGLFAGRFHELIVDEQACWLFILVTIRCS